LVNFLPLRDLTDEQKKRIFLIVSSTQEHLETIPYPIDQMKDWIENKLKRNSKTVTKSIDELHKIGLI